MNNSRILVVAPAWIGDLIISLSFLRALKNIDKNSKIDLLVNEDLVDIVKYFPIISNIISSQTSHGKLSLLYRIKLGLKLRKNNYRDCYILPNSFKSSIIPFIAGVRNRISYLGEFRYGLVNKIIKKIDRKEGMVNRYLNLINHKYQSEYQPALTDKIGQNNNTHRLLLKKKYLVFCPDAEFGPSKRWPVNKWMDLAESLKDKFQIVFVGLDTTISSYINETHNDSFLDLIGKTSLDEVIDILGQSCCVVSNDSGLMHVAAALNLPVVGIYGSSSPQYTPPLIDDAKRVLIYKSLDCSPCYKRECPYDHMNCLNNISVEDVKQSISKLV